MGTRCVTFEQEIISYEKIFGRSPAELQHVPETRSLQSLQPALQFFFFLFALFFWMHCQVNKRNSVFLCIDIFSICLWAFFSFLFLFCFWCISNPEQCCDLPALKDAVGCCHPPSSRCHDNHWCHYSILWPDEWIGFWYCNILLGEKKKKIPLSVVVSFLSVTGSLLEVSAAFRAGEYFL